MTPPKSGPLSQDELMALFRASVDSAYGEPLFAAGDGNGLEVYSQLAAILARASAAVDRTTQALYYLPFSGQTSEPAGDEANATVMLQFSRTGLLASLLVLRAGTFVEEVTTDYATDAGIAIRTGRRYALGADVTFLPGVVTVSGEAIAEKPGFGFNNPLPDTLTSVVQNASGFTNTGGTVTLAAPGTPLRATLIGAPMPDMFVPDHVGQYVRFVTGANAGTVARIVTYFPANPPASGSAVEIAYDGAVDLGAITGAFVPNEAVTMTSGTAVVTSWDGERLVFVLTSGIYAPGDTVTGRTSAATGTIAHTVVLPSFVAEVGAAAWRILDWVVDYGLTVTNDASPEGGALGMLEMLGEERGLPRGTDEPIERYRRRITQPADVVSPNAIRRTLNRILGPLGLPFTFFEVGSVDFPGMYYDGDNIFPASGLAQSTIEDAYDTDVLRFTYSSGPSTPFVFQEPVALLDSENLERAHGWFGSFAAGVFLMIRKDGSGSLAGGGFTIVGRTSGAVFTPSAFVPTTTAAARRFRVYLDTTQYRAFFLIGLQRTSLGEFGFAYDTYPWGAYDGGVGINYPNFYDGFPRIQANLYRQIAAALLPVRAGGVGFDFYLLD